MTVYQHYLKWVLRLKCEICMARWLADCPAPFRDYQQMTFYCRGIHVVGVSYPPSSSQIKLRIQISSFVHLNITIKFSVYSKARDIFQTFNDAICSIVYHLPVKVELRKMRMVLVFTGHCSSMKPCSTLCTLWERSDLR